MKYKKVRRGGKSVTGIQLKVISTNSQGDKFDSLVSLVKNIGASVFMVQETRSRKKGKYSSQYYVIFESIRQKVGGGSLMGVHKSFNPKLINVYDQENFELIIVEAKVANKEMRFITGYGPQENWSEEEKLQFFVSLDQEISRAQLSNKSVFIAFDANSKMGQEYIPNDPHNMSPNGHIMAEIIEKNALCVVNGMEGKCSGVITRVRSTDDGNIEKSAIDLVIVSSDMVEYIVSLQIDEARKNVLTKVTKNKKGDVKIQESDHNILETSLNIKVKKMCEYKKE